MYTEALSLFSRYEKKYSNYKTWTTRKGEVVPIQDMQTSHINSVLSLYQRKKEQVIRKYLKNWEDEITYILEDSLDFSCRDADIAYACHGSSLEFAESNLALAKESNILCCPLIVVLVLELEKRKAS
jgi:hypothetical protein